MRPLAKVDFCPLSLPLLATVYTHLPISLKMLHLAPQLWGTLNFRFPPKLGDLGGILGFMQEVYGS
jgi:hypothetical protein